MARSSRHAYDFIKDSFAPMVAVLTSEDAENVSRKNDLSFVELIRPFCQLSNEVHIRDPVNPNVVIPIKGFKIRVMNVDSPPPPTQLINKILNEVVSKSVTDVDLKTPLSKESEMNATTPWYEAYQDCLFQLLKPLDHEFLRHIISCIIVVSTNNPDPMGAFVSLSAKQTTIQQSQSGQSNPYIKWFSVHTFKYYVLLHDVSEGHEFKADAVFQSMKSVYGSHTCFLLQINSKAKMLPNAAETAPSSDQWNQFIYPFDDETFDIGDDVDDNADPKLLSSSPAPATQAEADKEEAQILHNLEKAEKMAEELNFSPSLRFQDPLTSMHYNESLETNEANDLGPLKPSPPDLVKDIPQFKRRMSQLKVNEYRKCMKQFSFEMLPSVARNKEMKKKGQALTLMDHDRIKTFVYEFCVRGLLPHIEKMMRTLSEQILSRKGIHRSIFNVTKKWFGGTKSPPGKASPAAGSDIGYHVDSAELQQRKLGDLAFLVQHYELAFNSYHASKRDFNNDRAWIYFAGALEMAAMSAFMQGPQRTYPKHYFDACISTYLTAARLPEYATRACLMSTEALKAKKMYADAAVEFIKLTNEECDLRSALLLEQAAHCYLHNNPPMTRKYAFHMILAGHRYSKAVQRKHTLRCYTNALSIYKDKDWHLAEDHMNFISGRQCFNLGQVEDSQNALRKLLVYESQQQPYQQASHLREFLAVFKQNIEKTNNAAEAIAPDLPLPKIDGQSTRVILTTEVPSSGQLCDTPTLGNPALDLNRTRTIIAGQCSFRRNYNKNYIKKWSEAERQVVEKITGSSVYPWRPNIPCLSNATDNSYQPKCMVGETFSVEVVFVNPLKVPLNLLSLQLLWEFTPSEASSEDGSTVFSNQKGDHPDIVSTDVIKNVIIKGQERKLVPLHVTFLKTGELKIIGVKHVLSSISVLNPVDDDGRIELNAVQDTTLLTFGVAGRQELTVRGPRLNGTKKERIEVLYGNDYRLQPRVLPAMPKLQIWMINFPITLLCGEVRMTQFVFKNDGKVGLKNLHIYCNHPQSLSIDTQSTTDDINSKDSIYEMLDGGRVHHSHIKNISCQDNERPVKVPLKNEVLLPGEEISVPVWIHGITSPGVHELDFIFYYESVESRTDVPYRVLHQTVRIQTLATLSLSTCVKKSSSSFFSSNEDDQNFERSEDNSLISMSIENRAQGSAFPRCVEFTVLQISCFSNDKNFTNVGKGSSTYQKLRPGETLLMYLKASKDFSDSRNSELCKVSQIAFTDQVIDGAKSPAIDFFSKTPFAQRILDSTQRTSARIGLVVFWQTSYIDDSCVRHIIYGQTHTGVLDDISTSSALNQQQTLSSLVSTTHYDLTEKQWSGQRSEPVLGSITLILLHPSKIEHDFQKFRLCEVPVQLCIRNTCETEVSIVVRPKGAVETSNEESKQDETSSATINSIVVPDSFHQHPTDDHQTFLEIQQWIGKTTRRLTLNPCSCQNLVFKAIVLRAGLYNLNAFEIARVEGDTAVEIAMLRDQAILQVQDTNVETLQNDLLSEIMRMDQ